MEGVEIYFTFMSTKKLKQMEAKKLTAQEKETLMSFIGKCVLEGAKFPGVTIGIDNVTIQQLVTERTIDSLEQYGDAIEKRASAQGSSFKSKKGPLKFGTILASDLINALHLIIQHKEYQAHVANLTKKKVKLQEVIDNAKSPQDLAKEAAAELLMLNKELEEA